MSEESERTLADALVGVMLTEAVPEAYSRNEGDTAWDEALDALKGRIPEAQYEVVERTARNYRDSHGFGEERA